MLQAYKRFTTEVIEGTGDLKTKRTMILIKARGPEKQVSRLRKMAHTTRHFAALEMTTGICAGR
jgi:hypothetical protein